LFPPDIMKKILIFILLVSIAFTILSTMETIKNNDDLFNGDEKVKKTDHFTINVFAREYIANGC
jgi:thioredoxin-related protein